MLGLGLDEIMGNLKVKNRDCWLYLECFQVFVCGFAVVHHHHAVSRENPAQQHLVMAVLALHKMVAATLRVEGKGEARNALLLPNPVKVKRGTIVR